MKASLAATHMQTHAATLPPPRSLQLYDDPHSLFCCKARVVLLAKGVAYQSLTLPCGSASSPEYLRIVPLGKIPALVVHEADSQAPFVLMETEVINEWLEERFPQPNPLMPESPALRAQARLLSRFHDIYLQPALGKVYGHVSPATRDAGIVAAAAAEFRQRLGQLERLLQDADRVAASQSLGRQSAVPDAGEGPEATAPASPGPSSRSSDSNGYAVGGRLSLADAGYAPLFLYADLIWEALGCGMEAKWRGGAWPRVSALRAALDGDPHVTAALAALRPEAVAWVQKKLAIT